MKLIDFFAGLIHNRGKWRPAKKSINFIGYHKKIKKKIGFKGTYPYLKDSLGPDI